jgi:hypothetical protein
MSTIMAEISSYLYFLAQHCTESIPDVPVDISGPDLMDTVFCALLPKYELQVQTLQIPFERQHPLTLSSGRLCNSNGVPISMFLPKPIHDHFHKSDGKQKGQFMPNAKPITLHFEVNTKWYQQFQASMEEEGPELRGRGGQQGVGGRAKRSRRSASLSGSESPAVSESEDEPRLDLTVAKKKVRLLKIGSVYISTYLLDRNCYLMWDLLLLHHLSLRRSELPPPLGRSQPLLPPLPLQKSQSSLPLFCVRRIRTNWLQS